MNKLLVIVGPTASGKSQLAMDLAARFNGEIIAADSRTVYRGMDIGTAKPTKDEMLQIAHHLVDVAEPGQSFTAAEFQRRAKKAIDEISSQGKLPILVGGTGLYIDSVIFDYQFPSPADPKLRAELEKLSEADLFRRLEEADPASAAVIDRHNRRRVLRAVETAGQPRAKSRQLRPGTLVLGMAVNKETIQKRIEQRVEKMLCRGFFEEVKTLGEKYGWESEALTGIGYRAFRAAAEGRKTIAEAAADFVRGDMELARRQMTWFKRNPHIHWLEPSDTAAAVELVERFLSA